MTHAELVEIAYRWLLGARGCSFALKELVCGIETADAIGFRDGQSTLIECKTSRGDFLADGKKIFRKMPGLGMGSYRLFMCKDGLIMPSDLPDRWGLIWVNDKRKARLRVGPKGNIWSANGHNFYFPDKDEHAEWCLMASALRRLHLRGVLPMIYEQERRIA